MKKIIRYSFIAAIAAVSFSSCKKDDDKTRTELLTEGNWKLISDQEKIGTAPWEEYISSYSPCELDNYLKFNTNNLVEANEGPTLCDPGATQSFSGPWAFVNNETQLSIYGDVGTIDELTASRLTVSYVETVGSTTYYYKQTYSH